MSLCARCRTELKPVVALDIDGTLADYHSHFLDFAADWLGPDAYYKLQSAALYDGAEPHREWFCRTFNVDETTFRAIKLAFRQGSQKRTMPIYPGVPELIMEAQDAGAEVWLTTTRPWERFDRVDPDTREWLRRNEIEFDGLIYDEDKMVQLYRLVGDRVCFVMDDLPEILAAAERLWKGVSVLRKTRFNRGVTWHMMVPDLDSARGVVKGYVESWRISHAFDHLPETEER